jgi:hypothetical protein
MAVVPNHAVAFDKSMLTAWRRSAALSEWSATLFPEQRKDRRLRHRGWIKYWANRLRASRAAGVTVDNGLYGQILQIQKGAFRLPLACSVTLHFQGRIKRTGKY